MRYRNLPIGVLSADFDVSLGLDSASADFIGKLVTEVVSLSDFASVNTFGDPLRDSIVSSSMKWATLSSLGSFRDLLS